jgi:uncharacterized protein (DUF1330 family)
MPAYTIANVTVTDQTAYDGYRAHTLATVEKYGGKFLVRGGAAEKVEGTWQPQRMVILQFADMATAKQWYHSPEYQAIIGGRHKGAQTDMVFVEGVA